MPPPATSIFQSKICAAPISNDTLTGDGNNNVLEGGTGTNTLDGGNGFDTASYEHAAGPVTVSLAAPGPQTTGGAGIDTLTNIEALRGSSFDDTLTGNGSSVLEGGPGNDHLIGQAGQNDTASYEHATSAVTVNLAITSQQDTHGAGLDTLTNIANLMGSQFNDTLTGDSHNNTLFGNGGNDTFAFNTAAPGGTGQDTIGDFMSGQDHIQLDYAAFNPSDASSFNAWLAGHVTIVNSGSDILIDLNPDGQHAGSRNDPVEECLLWRPACQRLHPSCLTAKADRASSTGRNPARSPEKRGVINPPGRDIQTA